jgi:predicted unusual protein kinase regulating ubiquinone biosynthesis (AarF/ABC1/UbiB family)
MERFGTCLQASGFDDEVRTPAVEWSHTTRRVLTMEHIEGQSFDELSTSRNWGNEPSELLRKVASTWLVAALRYGIVHGDLHAGNLMVDRDGRVVFLDFGITAALDAERRDKIRDGLVGAIALGDFGPMARLLCELDVRTSVDLDRVSADLAATLKPVLDQPLTEISAGEVLGALVATGTRNGVKIPQGLILLAKQLLYFEHYATSMAHGGVSSATPPCSLPSSRPGMGTSRLGCAIPVAAKAVLFQGNRSQLPNGRFASQRQTGIPP